MDCLRRKNMQLEFQVCDRDRNAVLSHYLSTGDPVDTETMGCCPTVIAYVWFNFVTLVESLLFACA